jgi:hypothetical protein
MVYPSREYDVRGVCGDKSKEGGWISVDREASSLSTYNPSFHLGGLLRDL